MKHYAFTLSLAALALVSCNRKNDDANTGVDGPYPTDNLVVLEKQYALLSETTGSWCQYCPNGARAVKEAEVQFGSFLLPVGLHTNDPLSNPTSADWEANYPTTGVPNFYVGNDDAGQDIEAKLLALGAQEPFMGVAHTVQESADAYTVYAKVKVFKPSTTSNYLIQSYLLADVQAKGFSGVDLTQVSSVPIVNQGTVNEGSYWTQDLDFLFGNGTTIDTVRIANANERYFHEFSLIDRSNTDFSWGASLDTINPFGTEYLEDDVFGTKFTPIKLVIEKKSIAPIEVKRYHILTVIWKFRQDGTIGYDFINGDMTHLGDN